MYIYIYIIYIYIYICVYTEQPAVPIDPLPKGGVVERTADPLLIRLSPFLADPYVHLVRRRQGTQGRTVQKENNE
jgi:hypothetical protein